MCQSLNGDLRRILFAHLLKHRHTSECLLPLTPPSRGTILWTYTSFCPSHPTYRLVNIEQIVRLDQLPLTDPEKPIENCDWPRSLDSRPSSTTQYEASAWVPELSVRTGVVTYPIRIYWPPWCCQYGHDSTRSANVYKRKESFPRLR